MKLNQWNRNSTFIEIDFIKPISTESTWIQAEFKSMRRTVFAMRTRKRDAKK